MSDLTLVHSRSADGTVLDIALAGRLAIDTAAELLDLFREELPTAQKIRLDLSDLAEIDLNGIQLLCAACRTALVQDHSFNLTGSPAPCIQEAIGIVGLQRHTTCKHNASMPCIWCGGIN